MNNYDGLYCHSNERPHDYREDMRLLPVHPLSASTLALSAPLEWCEQALARGEPPMPFADPSAQY
jgi:hypothetical protein